MMALYDGFFDAMEDDHGNIDRAYNSGDFTGYFEQIVGSGVCVYNNPDSFLVRFADGNAVVSPGYLFIRGYWLKNDADYPIHLDNSSVYAIVAHLDMGNRRIDVEAVPKAATYAGSLVLAYVTVNYAGEGTVEDTRHDPSVCGVIDAAGDLSSKVAWAVNYIDNEIEGRFAQIEADMNAQAADLDAAIARVAAEVEKLNPPPVGAIKFSAGQDVGDEWIRCDGSFISEDDYPELVRALGKNSPAISDFVDILDGSESGNVSNLCTAHGMAWVVLLSEKAIVGVSKNGTKVKIPIIGADDLANGKRTTLSINAASAHIVQNGSSAADVKVYECTSFSASAESLEFTDLNAASHIDGSLLAAYCYSGVTVSMGTAYLGAAYGKFSDPTSSLTVMEWSVGNFAGTVQSKALTIQNNTYRSKDYNTGTNPFSKCSVAGVSSLFGFSPKNEGEMLLPFFGMGTAVVGNSATYAAHAGRFATYSYPLHIYGDTPTMNSQNQINGKWFYVEDQVFSGSTENNPDAIYDRLPDEAKEQYEKYVTNGYQTSRNIIPIAGESQILFGARTDLAANALSIEYCSYSPQTWMQSKNITEVHLPSRSRLFPDSACYAMGLWFIFLGTGLMFTDDLSNGKWGFFNTQSVLGTVTASGGVYFSQEEGALYISGLNHNGVPVIGVMDMSEAYNYATDGTFLPNIEGDGVPAYIKAYEPRGS